VKELLEVGVVKKDAGPVIATIERVVNQAVGDQSRLSSHASSLRLGENKDKRKNELTPISLTPISRSDSPMREQLTVVRARFWLQVLVLNSLNIAEGKLSSV
jgi:hypothetical protein